MKYIMEAQAVLDIPERGTISSGLCKLDLLDENFNNIENSEIYFCEDDTETSLIVKGVKYWFESKQSYKKEITVDILVNKFIKINTVGKLYRQMGFK